MLPLESTGRNPELEEVLGALSLLLNGGGVGQLEIITRELNAVFDGRQDRVRSVLRELDTLVGGLDEQKDDIISALESLNGLASTLNEEKETVVAALDEFGPAVTVLADQHDQLIRMLKALDRLGVVGTRVVGATKEDLLKSLRHLEPIVREIADVDDQIPEALGLLISFPFPIESNDIVYGDYANTSIVFSLDLNNLFQNQEAPGTDLPGLPDGELPSTPTTRSAGSRWTPTTRSAVSAWAAATAAATAAAAAVAGSTCPAASVAWATRSAPVPHRHGPARPGPTASTSCGG